MQSTPQLKLLLVDDDPSMLRMLTWVVSRTFDESIRVETLNDPVAAAEHIEDTGVDILLTDLEMPGIDGLELLRTARRRNARAQVVLLTGHATSATLLEALECGASDYLLKPVDRQDLITVLTQARDRLHRWHRSFVETLRQHGAEPTAVH